MLIFMVDVIEYKQLLACKISEADVIEKEESELLEARMSEIRKVWDDSRFSLGTRNEDEDIGRTVQERFGGIKS